jgi:disulfide oxidoreductase YuzD
MSKDALPDIKWLSDVEEQDYPAAESYLTILYSQDKVTKMMVKFRASAVVKFKTVDIFRACQLPLKSASNSQVKEEIRKISKGERLSPILLLRDEMHGKVVIADGYHRMCAVYEVDEEAVIPCKII